MNSILSPGTVCGRRPSRPARHRPRLARTAAGLALAGLLTACGGGGGGDGASTAVTLSGVAATGAAMVGARVRVIDASGVEVAHSEPVGADGRFSVTLPAQARAPFVLVAELEEGEPQVAVFPRAASSTVNVTPLTSLMAARLSSNGQPLGLADDFRDRNVPSAAAIQTRIDEVAQFIRPLADVLGDRTHPLTGNFAVGGTGHDKLLDSLAVTVVPQGAASSNIEVTVRTVRGAGEPLPAVSFDSNAPIPALPPVTSRNQLGAEGLSARIGALVDMMNACYALPQGERASNGSIRPGPCRDMYFGSNPETYLSYGNRVGAGAAASLFAGTRVVFDRPVFEYVRREDSGRPRTVVFSVRWRNPDEGTSETVVLHARQNDNGGLGLFGNQYAYPMSVRPIVNFGTFYRPEGAGYDHVRVGYNVLVRDLRDAHGSVFDRVEVEPRGRREFVLRPVEGFPHLRMAGRLSPIHTSTVVWLNGDFREARQAPPLHPMDLSNGGSVWAIGAPWSDQDIENIRHKSVWRFEYFLRGNTSDVPNAVQYMTTISRAPSVREAWAMTAAELNPASLDWLRDRSMDSAVFWLGARPGGTGPWPTQAPDFQLGWTVPEGAPAPTAITLFGRGTLDYAVPWDSRTPFQVSARMRTNMRNGVVPCIPDTAVEHEVCETVGGIPPARFSRRTMLTDVQLWAVNPRQVEVARTYFTHAPALRPPQP